MMHTITFSVVTLALLGMTSTASAYFAEDFAITPTPIAMDTAEMITVTPVIMPAADTALSRALFTAMVVEQHYSVVAIHECYWDIASSVPPQFTKVFADVATDHPYAKHLCIAMRDGLIRGYGDGTFRPDQPITMAEASRILARAYNLTPYADAAHYDLWFEPYVWALTNYNAIPLEIESLAQPVTVAIAQDMVVRVRDDLRMLPSRTYQELVAPPVSIRIAPASATPEPTVTEQDSSTFSPHP